MSNLFNRLRALAAFKEGEHPRGQPENEGEFVKKGGAKAALKLTKDDFSQGIILKGAEIVTKKPSDRKVVSSRGFKISEPNKESGELRGIRKDAPKYCYHGTTMKHALGILKSGNRGSISFTGNPQDALGFAWSYMEHDKEDAVVLRIETHKMDAKKVFDNDMHLAQHIVYKGQLKASDFTPVFQAPAKGIFHKEIDEQQSTLKPVYDGLKALDPKISRRVKSLGLAKVVLTTSQGIAAVLRVLKKNGFSSEKVNASHDKKLKSRFYCSKGKHSIWVENYGTHVAINLPG